MIQIIPAIDIINGQCVRLTQGDYQQKKIYDENPVELAQKYADLGCRRLHLVDLDAAKAGRPVNQKIVSQIAKIPDLEVDYGGGLKHKNDFKMIFDSGIAMATGGSIAIRQPDVFNEIISYFGVKRIILGADFHGENIAIDAWQTASEINLYDHIKNFYDKGLRQVIATDVSTDGTLKGAATQVYQKILKQFTDIQLIASGGVGEEQHLLDLENMGVRQVIVGKAIYEKTILVDTLKKYL